MTDQADTPTDPDAPIDASFEPAAKEGPDNGGSKGPGWFALGTTGVSAAILGAVIATGLDQVSTENYAPETIIPKVATLEVDQDAIESRLTGLADELANAETRLSREISGAAAASGDSQAIDALTTEIETLNQRLDEAMLGAGEGDTGPLPALIERLETLERADEDEVTSPRLMNRAVTALRDRVDLIETTQADILSRQELRAQALADLTGRLDTLAESAPSEADGADTSAPAEPDPQLVEEIAAIRAELETLKVSSTSESAAVQQLAAQSETIATLQQDLAVLREQQSSRAETVTSVNAAQAAAQNTTQAMIALLNVEAAARQGQPFQTAYAELSKALPNNEQVTRLQPLAVSGAPTFASLQSRFDDAAVEAREAALAAGQADDGWSWVRRVFGDGIEVNGEPVASDPLISALGEARQSLEAEDLDAALTRVKTVEGAAGDVLSDWVEAAERRLALETGLDNLRLALLDSDR